MTGDELSSDVDVGDDDVHISSLNNGGIGESLQRDPLNRAEQISYSTAIDIKSILLSYLTNIGVSVTTLNSLNVELTSLVDQQFDTKTSQSATTTTTNNNSTTTTNTNSNIVNTTTATTTNTATATATASESSINNNTKNDEKFDGSTLELLAKLKSIYSEYSQSRFKGRKRFLKAKKESYTYTHSTVVDQQLESSNAVQITANRDALKKRIDTFVSKKRLENSDFNTCEFRSDDHADINDSARTYPFPPSKIKETRTTNEEGPLVISEQEREQMKYKPFIDERLNILENHIGIDINQRLQL
ncbi:hypothetical protein PPL_12366 [Heterostelium album PN500]|uniref:Uncharacterized protein n=1 Tax=Heterostelium pallidum (strain ATCC 26659 / Pp 5 / PN500) TaxID=670386 RepID=D3BME6_HETP5|nr:hypothetical protein PPL_12366 [Heterostelium album PN500]EFA77158.1 hypothetical protein PPL_12366 [Heterostelium album PN500]|eukprot:XP_020429287.1 hypothetical protein PPL_12366 [Heterostelium album PN500]